MDPEIVERLNEQFREMSDILSQQNASMAAMMKAMNEQAAASAKAGAAAKNQTNAANANANATEGLTKKQLAYQQAEEERIQKANQTISRFNKALDFTAGTVMSLGRTVMDSTQSFQKYNGVIGSVGDTALDLGRNFGILGSVLGGVVKVSTEVLKYQLEQKDNLLKFSDDVSKMGAVNQFSTAQIQEMANQIGLTTKELDKMTKPMQRMGTSLTAMGNGIGDSVTKFKELNDVSEETRNLFRRMGYNDEQRIEAFGNFIDTMAIAGVSVRNMAKDSEGLRKSSQEYIKNLHVLSEITGKSAEEQQKAQQVATATVEFQLYSNKMEQEAAELERQGRQKEADAKREEIKQAVSAVELARKLEGEAGGAAMAQQIMMGFTTIDQAISGRAIMGTTGTMDRVAEQVRNREFDAKKYEEAQMEAGDRMRGRMAELAEPLIISGDFRKAANIDDQARINELNRLRGKEPVADKAIQDQKDLEAGKGAVGTDPSQALRDAFVETERKLRLWFDAFVGGMGLAVPAVVALAGAAGVAALALASLRGLGGLGGVLGGGKGISAPTNLQSQKDLRMDYARQLRKQGFSPKESLRIARDQYPNSSFAEFDKKATAITKNNQMSKLERLTSRFSSKVDDLGKMSRTGKVLSGTSKWLGRAAVPLTVLSAGVEGYMGYKAASDQEKAGQITADQAKQKKGEAIGGAVGGGLGGAAGGALAGAALGSVVPIVGTAIGGILGGALGYYLGNKAGTAIGGAIAGPSGSTKENEQKAKDEKIEESKKYASEQLEKSIGQFSSVVTSFGSMVTSFGKVVTAYAKTTTAFAKVVGVYASATKKLAEVIRGLKPGLGDENSELDFAKMITAFGSIVTSFGKIVTSEAIAIKAFAVSVRSFAASINKLLDVIKGPQQKTPLVDSVAKSLLGNKQNERLQRRQSNLENIIGNSLLETEDTLSPMEKFENSIDALTLKLDSLREAETKRHTFNEISMRQFRQSLDDASKKLDKIAGITRQEEGEPSGAPGGAPPSGEYGAPAGKVLEAGKGYTTVEYEDGRVEKREGSRNWRNNNPGNLEYGEFAKKYGAIGSDGRFAVFASYEQGRAAKEALLFKSDRYKDLSIGEAISRYAPPGENNTRRYIRTIEKATGRNANTPLQDLTPEQRKAMMDAMEKVEGFKQGKVEVLREAQKIVGGSLKDLQGSILRLGGGITGNARNLENINPRLDAAAAAAFKEYNQRTGKKVTLTSGFRYPGDQAKIDSGNNPKAQPGFSRHERGLAIDINSSDVSAMNQLGILEKYGLIGGTASNRRGGKSSDPPHIELKAKKGGVFDGPDSGYPVEMHGSEMIAPLNTNSVLMKLAKTPAEDEGVKQVINPTSSMEKETIEKIVSMNSEMMDAMLNRLDEMVNAINDGNDTRQKILKNSQN